MRRVETGSQDIIGPWVARHCPCDWNPALDVAIAVVDDDLAGTEEWVRGGVIFTMNTGRAIFIHVAGRGQWMIRDFVWVVFHYAFRSVGAEWLYAIIEDTNHRALGFNLRFGFSVVTRLPGLFASGDGVVVSMHRDRCPWLALKPRTIRPR